MYVYKLTISYDGTDFYGWQIQKNKRTVQGVIYDALKRFFPYKFRLIGASRTDRGVHAEGQVASLHLPKPLHIELPKFHRALNASLPEDIYIKQIEKAPANFHARFSAKGKLYRYNIRQARNPFTSRYEWQIDFELDLDHLRKMANLIKGKFDFSHIHIGDKTVSPVVNLFYTDVEKSGDKIIFHIAGDRFTYKLVRLIVGEMVYNARKKLQLNEFRNFLYKQRPKTFHIAPAVGLYLVNVFY